MLTLTINNQKVEVAEGTTLMPAIESIGIKVPNLCYHKALLPYGACRLCLVEVGEGKWSKVHASCTHPVLNGIIVRTDTERVIRIRKIVAELLLARCPDLKPACTFVRSLSLRWAAGEYRRPPR